LPTKQAHARRTNTNQGESRPMSLTFEQATALVGSNFMVQTQAGPVELELAQANEGARRGLPERFRTPLSLIFRGPGSIQLAQDLYAFEHSAIGRHEWMLVPVMADMAQASPAGATAASPLHYEVVFA
jgi:hypothetical protein